MGILLRCSPIATRRIFVSAPQVRQGISFALRALATNGTNNTLLPLGARRSFSDAVKEVHSPLSSKPDSTALNNSYYNIPKRLRQKVVTAEDAVSLVRSGDSIAVSGFVCQGAPEAVLRALGQKYEAEGGKLFVERRKSK
jgi:hypothetical protein